MRRRQWEGLVEALTVCLQNACGGLTLISLHFILRTLKILLGSFLVLLAVKIDSQASCQQ